MNFLINYFKSSIWTILSFIFVILLILVPLASFLSYSFFTVDGLEINHELSLSNYKEFLVGEIYIRTLLRTILLALIVMFSCIILGYPVAYFLARYAGKFKYAILLIAPFLDLLNINQYLLMLLVLVFHQFYLMCRLWLFCKHRREL